MLVSGETDLDVPEVVHHVDSENPNTHDADDDFEEKVIFYPARKNIIIVLCLFC
jgi:hypothetical protein